MKWRLMAHNEMQDAYDYDWHSANPNHAYITNATIDCSDPLFSIDVCDGDNEEHNTNLALAICEELNSRFEPIIQRKDNSND